VSQDPKINKITVILCTYNRCASLQRALEGVSAQEPPHANDWEVLVVDNNSSDSTRQVVADFCRRYPGRFRYVFEAQAGKSYALNTGIREAEGDILAFIDDDVRVEPAWLRNLTASLNSADWAGAGGRILPEWSCAPPRWLALEGYSLAPLALFDLSLKAGELTEPPFGTNMAFRREMFEKYGGFRTDLGPNPYNMIRGEDTEFGGRLLAAGEQLRYEPDAVIYHPASVDRLRKSYFLGWWLAKGRSDIREFGIRPNTRYRFCGVPLYLLRNLIGCTLRWMLAIRPEDRFLKRRTVWYKIGQLYESCRPFLAPQDAATGSAKGDAKPLQ
jgi:glycosyltransferase involved in cell wall biosynthesis